jgi:hypothetical protein
VPFSWFLADLQKNPGKRGGILTIGCVDDKVSKCQYDIVWNYIHLRYSNASKPDSNIPYFLGRVDKELSNERLGHLPNIPLDN